ncbi:unnamed protein product [Didymodactylos carnosus]|nr:unnamed protein product [Didymodactylos carnosus]CAF4482322.1 unnamed protein product [Didymodactylos carnosus]
MSKSTKESGVNENQSKPVCSKCNSTENVISIVYGYPGDELMKSAREGHVKLGGCCVSPDSKRNWCKKCSDYV